MSLYLLLNFLFTFDLESFIRVEDFLSQLNKYRAIWELLSVENQQYCNNIQDEKEKESARELFLGTLKWSVS